MMNEYDDKTPVNDNRFRYPSNAVDGSAISDRLEAALGELSSIGAGDAAIIDALFSSMFDLAYRAHLGDDEKDPEGRRSLERYNQLSRLSGELDGLMAMVWRDWVDHLSQA